MREITFRLPGFPQLTIYAREVEGKVVMDFTVAPGSRASLQGIYLDTLNESGIAISGDHITSRSFGDTSMAGAGTNLNGHNGLKDGFDFGLGIGNPGRGQGIVQHTSITLENIDKTPLTLDSLSHELLGIRLQGAGSAGPKHVMVMPAAPDAIDDVLNQGTEDTPLALDPLANDTDADGDVLSIVSVAGVDNGTVLSDGKTLVFNATAHWSGEETFSYRIADGTGGFDVAYVTVQIDAVADAVTLGTEVVETSNVHEVVIDISSALQDMDGSEDYTFRISGLENGATLALVDGVTYDAASGDYFITNPDGLDRITVQLLDGRSYDFDLRIDAIATELIDGDWNWDKTNDTRITSTSVAIDVDFVNRDQRLNFQATDQSQWDTGDQFVFTYNEFWGVDTGLPKTVGWGGFLSGNATYDFKLGLQNDLRLEGGEIDATVPWDLSIDSTYNRTTDVLRIDTDADVAAGGAFKTQGPELLYKLDLVIEAYLRAAMSIVIDFGALGTLDEDIFDETFLDIDWTANLINFDSKTAGPIEVELPYGITATFQWPNLEVGATDFDGDGTFGSSGASNKFFDLNLDIDTFIADVFFGGTNPFDVGFDWTVVYANLELLDADINAGLNFLQNFLLDTGDLKAELVFEDGSRKGFAFGDTLVFEDASDLDVNGNGDVEFTIDMDLVGSKLTNDTDLGILGGWNFDILKGKAGYDTVIFGSDEVSFGPLVDLGGEHQLGAIDIYSKTFELLFGGREFDFVA